LAETNLASDLLFVHQLESRPERIPITALSRRPR
jgi:hypothetical protein